jgi:hypothetical protein
MKLTKVHVLSVLIRNVAVQNLVFHRESSFGKCSDGAKAEWEKANANPQPGNADADDNDRPEFAVEVDEREVDELYAAINSEGEITDDDIERARLMTTDARERLYGENAVWLGDEAGFFEDITKYDRTSYFISYHQCTPKIWIPLNSTK